MGVLGRTWVVCASVVALLGVLVTAQLQSDSVSTVEVAKSARSTKNAMSTFEWRRLDKTPLNQMVAPLSRFARFGGKTVSLDLSYVVDLSEISNAKMRKAAQTAATKKLRAYVKAANARGLRVEALAGDPRWAEPEVRYVNQIVQRYVTSFNRGATRSSLKLAGTHFDIEPWGRRDWAANRARLTRELLETVQAMVRNQRSVPKKARVPITVDLPFWWDGTSSPRSVRFAGRNASPTAHVMRLLDVGQRAGVKNAVAVMAYRDQTGGRDGSVALVKREFAQAKRHKGRVKVVVAQEIGNTQPARITFYQEGSRALKNAIKVHAGRFSGHPAWGGVAVDHLEALNGKLR